jgi:hypothetical protein
VGGEDAGSKPAAADAGSEPSCPRCTEDGLPAVSAPEVVGILIGPEADHPLGDLNVYGTDLGFAYEHKGKLNIMFGDTLPTPDDICNEQHNDDSLASLPAKFDGTVPELDFHKKTDAPNEFVPLQLMRGDESLFLGFGQAPTTAFSDGEHVYAMFDVLDLTRCSDDSAAACPTDDKFECSPNIGECQPSYKGVIPPLCDLKNQTGCFGGQQCVAAPAPPCVDPTSSQYDGTVLGEIASTTENNVLGVQRDDDPDTFDAVLSWPTNKFISLTTHTIAHLDPDKSKDDYAPGHESLLLWGRPRFAAERKREARLYLLSHDLPLQLDDAGQLKFAPHYFAGVDADGNAKWSDKQSEAKALAMDGEEDGDAHEVLHITNHSSVTWLGEPINKWVMLYGGGLSNLLLLDPMSAEYTPAPGAIMLRFADHPWGPWSPARPHLIPGSPTKKGDAYGPGGYLFNPSCANSEGAICAKPDGSLSTMTSSFDCLAGMILWDTGHLYGAGIIDPYTQAVDDGFEIVWTVSTWNPYAIVMLKTKIEAPLDAP